MDETESGRPTSSPGNQLRGFGLVVAFWLIGMLISFQPMIVSALGKVQTSLSDGRLVNYTLEHGYRWLTQQSGHEHFWNVPLFYPYPNVSAFTEVVLGVGPFYWIWRAVGCAPDTAFQLWLLTIWSLNFLVAFLLLRRCFRVGALAASCGAFLVAFGNVQQLHLALPQETPLFYVLLAVIALFGMFDFSSPASSAGRRRGWVAVFFAALTLQLYSCIYSFFFFGLLLALAGAWSLVLADSRRRVMTLLKEHWATLLLCTVLTGAAMGWLAQHYGITAENIGVRPYMAHNVPRWPSWLLTGPGNLIWGWLQTEGPFTAMNRPVHFNGVGLLTTVVCLGGLFAARRHLPIQILLLASGTTILLATMFGSFSFWEYIHAYVPGAAAIRVVGRVAIVLVLPAGIGLALAFEGLHRRRRHGLLAALALLCLAEQQQPWSWVLKREVRDHVREIARQVPADAEAFFLSYTEPRGYRYVGDDAAWVQLETGVPTINGRYGNFPPRWNLRDAQEKRLRNDGDRRRHRKALDAWIEENGLDPSRVAWIEFEGLRP